MAKSLNFYPASHSLNIHILFYPIYPYEKLNSIHKKGYCIHFIKVIDILN